jgi:hypothetical protein
MRDILDAQPEMGVSSLWVTITSWSTLLSSGPTRLADGRYLPGFSARASKILLRKTIQDFEPFVSVDQRQSFS